MSLSARDLSMIAQGWDAAVAAMRYEDGTPVKVVSMVNPYKPSTQPSEQESTDD
jgi:hypothetical protein